MTKLPLWTGRKPAANLVADRAAEAEAAGASLRLPTAADTGTAPVLTDALGRITRPSTVGALDAALAAARRTRERTGKLPALRARWEACREAYSSILEPLAAEPSTVTCPSPYQRPSPDVVRKVWASMMRETELGDVPSYPAMRHFHPELGLGVTGHWIVWDGRELPNRPSTTAQGDLPAIRSSTTGAFPAPVQTYRVSDVLLHCARVEAERDYGAAAQALDLDYVDASPWAVADLGHHEVGLRYQYLRAAVSGLRPDDTVRLGIADGSSAFVVARPDFVLILVMGCKITKPRKARR